MLTTEVATTTRIIIGADGRHKGGLIGRLFSIGSSFSSLCGSSSRDPRNGIGRPRITRDEEIRPHLS